MPTRDRRVLAFPGTTLIGLEVLASLRSLPGFAVEGAGVEVEAGLAAGFERFDYLPLVDDPGFEDDLRSLIHRNSIGYVIPANEIAIAALSRMKGLGAVVVSHPPETVAVAGSKIATHSFFAADGIVPARFTSLGDLDRFPVFSKPDIGHSSIGAMVIDSEAALTSLAEADDVFWETHLVTEFLSGVEVTVDCFSTPTQGLLLAAPRTRDSTKGGVSNVTTDFRDKDSGLDQIATAIAGKLAFTGPWFFQARQNQDGDFRLMEIGARLAGASGIRRTQGINLAQLAILASDNLELEVYKSDRAFTSRRIDGLPQVSGGETFDSLYIDLDDTLILNGNVNASVVELAKYVRNVGGYVAVITRHRQDPGRTLRKYGVDHLFDDVFHARRGEPKGSFIPRGRHSVLVDDSFSERISASSELHILAVDASAAPSISGLFRPAGKVDATHGSLARDR